MNPYFLVGAVALATIGLKKLFHKTGVQIPYNMVYDYVSSLNYIYRGKIEKMFIMAMIEIESSRYPNAKGDGGKSLGMMQLQSGAWIDSQIPYKYPDDAFDWKINIKAGVQYLISIYDHYSRIGFRDTTNKTRQCIITYNCGYKNYANNNCTLEYWNLVKDKRDELITKGGL